ncbi:hypothetical protein K1719_014461 [Acacia pycnantha]|nr:hypothetical protein K1719_014461 [Acacia pycnantha]
MGFDGFEFVPSVGRSGGLVVVWKKDLMDVVLLQRDRQFLHLSCSIPGKGDFHLTTVYAIPRAALKQLLWQELANLALSMSGPWVVAGDMNDILSPDERVGGAAVIHSRIDLFHSRLQACHLTDLGFHGPKFTWRGPRSVNCSRLYERLDRVVGNSEFLMEFSSSSVQKCRHGGGRQTSTLW